jgi:hypothetical protein
MGKGDHGKGDHSNRTYGRGYNGFNNRCWSSNYGCEMCWSAIDGCYFYYYEPACCYYPVSYIQQYPPVPSQPFQFSSYGASTVAPVGVASGLQVTNVNTNSLTNGAPGSYGTAGLVPMQPPVP